MMRKRMMMTTVVCQIPLKGDHPPPEEKPEVDLPRDAPARQPHPSKDFFQDIFHIFFQDIFNISIF